MEVFPAHLYRKFVKIIKIVTVFGFPILGPISGPILGPIWCPIGDVLTKRRRVDKEAADGQGEASGNGSLKKNCVTGPQ